MADAQLCRHSARGRLARPRVATEADLAKVIDDHVQSAIRADRAGFDLIELTAAHGYLLQEFMSPSANRREDRWVAALRTGHASASGISGYPRRLAQKQTDRSSTFRHRLFGRRLEY